MRSKRNNNQCSRRIAHRNLNSRRRLAKTTTTTSPNEITSDLIANFNKWCMSLRTIATFQFDNDEAKNHRCKMTFPIFPNLQSIGLGGNTKKEAKANAIIAFLAHMEKRKQVGLFVPYMFSNLYHSIQDEIRQANVPNPDLNINVSEYLLAHRMMLPRIVKKYDKLMKTIPRICNVRLIRMWQSTTVAFVYIVGEKSSEELIRPFAKALFEPDNEQLFNYGEKLFDIFNDEKFLDDVCQRLKVLCDNQVEKCKLFIRGSSVNVQCCYNEFLSLRREYEKEFHLRRKGLDLKVDVPSQSIETKSFTERLEATRIDQEERTDAEEKDAENNNDHLPDYSFYNDDVNASILRVLQNEENGEEQTSNQEVINNKEPILIEVSDDSSDSDDLQIVQTIQPNEKKKLDPILLKNSFQNVFQTIQPNEQKTPDLIPVKNPCQNVFQTTAPRFQSMPDYISLSQSSIRPPAPPPPLPLNQSRILRHIVLDGQNIARNSNDYYGSFSWSRLSNAINYFQNRGHSQVIAFLPLYLREYSNKQLPLHEMNRERQIRDNLINLRYIAFTPSRYHNGKRLTNYDDRFILQYAADNDGVVVSNDNFRDLQHEKNFQFIINNRILPFATINDTFMPATDPLGRNGPNIDEFLSKPCS